MDKGIIAVRNEFEKAVRTAEEKYLSRKRNGFCMYCLYAEGIFYTMGFHGKLQDLPKKSLDKLRQLGNLGKNYNAVISYIDSLGEDERIKTIAETFNGIMDGIGDDRNAILSQFGVAKGIIFVMQEFDTSSYLNQQKMYLHRNMTGSMMEMMNASDGMYD